ETRIETIAERANTTPRVVRAIRALHVHPSIYNPVQILRELWLDRAILLLLMFIGSFWFFSTVNVFAQVSIWWFLVPLVLLLPAFIFYARTVESDVHSIQISAL